MCLYNFSITAELTAYPEMCYAARIQTKQGKSYQKFFWTNTSEALEYYSVA